MRKIAVLMKILNWIIMVALCVFAILLVLDNEHALSVFGRIAGADIVDSFRLKLIVGAVALVLLGLNLLGLFGLVKKKHLKYINFKNPKGTVMVSVAAIQEALTRALLQHPQVHDARVAILVSRKKRKPLRVIASGALWEGSDIVNTQSNLQTLLEKRFKEILQIEENVVYDIRLEKFKFDKAPPKKMDDTPIDIADDEPTFTGIQYPIESEEDEAGKNE